MSRSATANDVSVMGARLARLAADRGAHCTENYLTGVTRNALKRELRTRFATLARQTAAPEKIRKVLRQ
jgi:hypothetical protein